CAFTCVPAHPPPTPRPLTVLPPTPDRSPSPPAPFPMTSPAPAPLDAFPELEESSNPDSLLPLDEPHAAVRTAPTRVRDPVCQNRCAKAERKARRDMGGVVSVVTEPNQPRDPGAVNLTAGLSLLKIRQDTKDGPRARPLFAVVARL